MTLEEIMMAYKNGEKTVEETNAALDAIGANIHIDPNKNPGGGWTEAEMEKGFIPCEATVALPNRPDMSRNMNFAGLVTVQKTNSGKYHVFYDEDGYATKAVKI